MVNPAYETALELKELLEQNHILNDGNYIPEGPVHQFYVSDAADKFRKFANSILPYDIDTTQLIQIEEY